MQRVTGIRREEWKYIETEDKTKPKQNKTIIEVSRRSEAALPPGCHGNWTDCTS